MENSLQLPSPTNPTSSEIDFLGKNSKPLNDCTVILLKIIALASTTVLVVVLGVPVLLGIMGFLITTIVMLYWHMLAWNGLDIDFDEPDNVELILQDLKHTNH